MSIARRCPISFLCPYALRACLFLLSSLFLRPVLCQYSRAVQQARREVAFTPPACLQGRSVNPDRVPASCEQTWFVVEDLNGGVHATRSPSSRAVLQFQGVGISWLSSPVTRIRGTADVFLDDRSPDRVQLSPQNTGPDTPAWSATGLDPHSIHNITIVPRGDDIINVDAFTIISSHDPSPTPARVLAAAKQAQDQSPAMRDGSSGTVISLASIGSVGLVVLICGGCFILGKRHKSPGFHMPTVLVDIETALDNEDDRDSDPPSPTTIRAWRESTQKGIAAEAAGEPGGRDRYPPNGASCSRPPSYRSGKDSLYRSDSSSQGHRYHWQ